MPIIESFKRSRKRYRATLFNPDHKQIKSATKEYLQRGGKITQLDPVPEPYTLNSNR